MTDHLEQPDLAHFNWWASTQHQARNIMADTDDMDEIIARAEACDAALQALQDAPGALEDKWGGVYSDMLRGCDSDHSRDQRGGAA